MEFKTVNKFNVKPEKLVEILTSEDYLKSHAEEYRSLSADVEYLKKNKSTIDLIVHKTEYARDMKGKVDKNNTENAEERQTWDLKKLSCTWEQKRDSFGSMVKISGKTSVEPDGNGSKIVNVGDISIKVPVIGKKIASSMISKIENDDGRYQTFMEGYLKKKKIK